MYYVEYIQTDQNCWFDTGIIPDINTKVELDITTPSSVSSDWRGFFGAQNTDDSPSTFQIRRYNRNNQFSARVGNGTDADGGPNYTTNTRYTLTLDKDYFVVNETQYSVGATSFDTCNYTLFINGINNPSWVNQYRAACGTYHRIKIWENGVLVGDFRPAVDGNDNVGFYDDVTHTFKQNLGTGIPVAGPIASSIIVTPSKTSLAATGETISIEVATENAWALSTSGDSFLTLSSTGDTSGATITATAPSYSGSTPREVFITFTDTTTSDTAILKIKQKKYTSGQPVYLGSDEITEIYLGDDSISEAYLGENLVYSSGPFVGLKLIPKSISFNSGALTRSCKVKSSEPWTMNVPAWLTASTLTGDTGETIVTITTTAQTADTSGVITVTSANYSASASCEYQEYQSVDYVYENSGSYQRTHKLDTGIAHTASTMTVQLKYKARGGNSDRMVGYQEGDEGCQYDTVDFRIFGYRDGTLDYKNNRNQTSTAINNNGQAYDLTIGDCFCYDNTNETYLVQLTPTGVVPSPNCHIYVDMSYIKVKEVKIMDGNNVLFDGKAAKLGNQYGLFNTVGGNFITTNDFTIVGEE